MAPSWSLRSRRNNSKKPYFVALEIQNGGFRGYLRPFSDSLRRVIPGHPASSVRASRKSKGQAQAAALRPPAATGYETSRAQEYRTERSWWPTRAFFNKLGPPYSIT